MKTANNRSQVIRVKESGGRDAAVLENGSFRVMVDDWGSMTPELSFVEGSRSVNAHWLPWFRGNSGKPFTEAEHGAFWKAGLLYNVAGNFPAIPNFGPGHSVDGIEMPAHGWTANCAWQFAKSGVDESGTAWALSTLKSPNNAMPLSFRKIDALRAGERIHYISVTVKNEGNSDLEICAGWHNTVGAPFLSEGCRISAAASAWATSPLESEFDKTTRLVPAAEFSSLADTPLVSGGRADLSRVPGPLGFTDFVSGRIDNGVSLGWSSVVNPLLKAAYVCFFPGPARHDDDDIVLRFTNLWMQYGGRRFTPWAAHEGGTDLTYCLGTENALAAYAQGLDYSRRAGTVLGAPVTTLLPAGARKTVRYGVLFSPYDANLDSGILALNAEAGALVACGSNGYWRFAADPSFGALKELERSV